MKIAVNSNGGLPRLTEALQAIGHEVVEDLWQPGAFVAQGIDAAFFEFRTIFNRKWRFVPLAYRLKRAGIPVVTWNLDAPWHMNRSKIRVNLLLKSGLVSIYATHSLQVTDRIRKSRVLYLPNAAWTSRYNLAGRTLNELEGSSHYRWDVSFMGNMSGERYPEHRARVAFLARLGRFLKERGISYRFQDTFSNPITVEEQIGIIQESRINLSCLAAADSTGEMSWGLTERSFGVPACGGFLLMEERGHVGDDFAHDEAATYAGFDDCTEKILYYLARHDLCREIAERGYRRVVRDHTYEWRALTLTAEIEKLKQERTGAPL